MCFMKHNAFMILVTVIIITNYNTKKLKSNSWNFLLTIVLYLIFYSTRARLSFVIINLRYDYFSVRLKGV